MIKSKWLTGVLAAVLVGASLVGLTGAASAQGPDDLLDDGVSVAGVRAWRVLVATVADETGLTQREVLQQVLDGESLAAICEANDCDPDEVHALVVADVTDAIDQALENERISQDQADEWLAALDEMVSEALASTDPLRPYLMDRLSLRAEAALLRMLRVAGDFTRLDLLEAAEDGLTPAELAAEAGLSEEDVIAQGLAHYEHLLQVMLDEARISQDEMDEALAAAETLYPEVMGQPLSDLLSGNLHVAGMMGRGADDGTFGLRGALRDRMDEAREGRGERFGRDGRGRLN